jgi:hypothetical protein
MDLGYDNPIVTAKSWCFLFAVRDWLVSKKTEAERKRTLEEEKRVPTWGEVIAQVQRVNKLKRAIEDWCPRVITPQYIEELNQTMGADEALPEAIVLRFLALWKKRNYGQMAQLFWRRLVDSTKKYAGEVREQYGVTCVERYEILRIDDKAGAIAEIDVRITEPRGRIGTWTFRLVREDERGDMVLANLEGGTWQIMWLHKASYTG